MYFSFFADDIQEIVQQSTVDFRGDRCGGKTSCERSGAPGYEGLGTGIGERGHWSGLQYRHHDMGSAESFR